MRKSSFILVPALLLLCSDALAEGPSQWTPITPLPQARNQAIAVAGLNGDIYIVDGYLAGDVLTSTMIRYNVLTDDYTSLASAPTGVRGPCAAALSDGTIVVFDGFINSGQNLTYIYDPNQDQWSVGNPGLANNGWECAAATDDNDIIHVFGGESGPTTHSAYDVANDSWQSLPPIPTARLQP